MADRPDEGLCPPTCRIMAILVQARIFVRQRVHYSITVLSTQMAIHPNGYPPKWPSTQMARQRIFLAINSIAPAVLVAITFDAPFDVK